MDISKINDILTNGIATDAFVADLNYHIFRKIYNRNAEINQLDKPERTLFNYLLGNSKEKTVLHLAKIYDNKSKYDTRCLPEVIKILQQNKPTVSENVFTKDNWIEFQKNYKVIFDYVEFKNEITINNFIDYFNRVFKKVKKQQSYKNLKIWRDKILAHNENYDSTDLIIGYEELEFLLKIPKAIIEFTNHFGNTESIIFPIDAESDAYFIDHLIEKYIE